MYLINLLKAKHITHIYNHLLGITVPQLRDLTFLTNKWVSYNSNKKDLIFYNENYDVSFIQLKYNTSTWIYPNCVYICLSGMGQVSLMRGYNKSIKKGMFIGDINLVTDKEVHKIINNHKHQTFLLEIKPFK